MGALAVVVAGCAQPVDLGSRLASLVWGGEQRLVANDAAELDELGRSVSLATDCALVGAYGESVYRGAAYVFVKSGNAWTQEQKLVASDGAEYDNFGWSVALAGDGAADRAIVGAYRAADHRGAVYIFGKNGDVWTEEQKLVATDGAEYDNFGWSVSLAGDRALVGAYGGDTARGAAYVFVRNGNVWIEEQKLVARDGVAGDSFGYSVALAAGRALVSAPGNDSYRGAAHVFVLNGNSWTEEQRLVASDGVANNNFGNAVSLAADRALVGAYWNDDFRGAGYVFARHGASWTQEEKLVASDGAGGDRFGGSVSLTADRALIGALGRGAAYVYARSDSSWTEEHRLAASDGSGLDLFGWSVSLAADRALVGASYVDQLRGAAYLFSQPGEDQVDAGDYLGPKEAGTSEPGGCTRGDDCTSGYCEDGTCCNRTCAPSERCRADLKVSGEDGVCGPAKAAARGAPCRFDVQCTSGHCDGADGVCGDPTAVGAPGGGGGCACHASGSGTHGTPALLGVALVLLLVRRTRRSSM